jgi:hypothetical protein
MSNLTEQELEQLLMQWAMMSMEVKNQDKDKAFTPSKNKRNVAIRRK